MQVKELYGNLRVGFILQPRLYKVQIMLARASGSQVEKEKESNNELPVTSYEEDNLSKAASSLFSVKMVAKLCCC